MAESDITNDIIITSQLIGSIEEKKVKNTVIASDSRRSGRSLVRMDIINEKLHNIKVMGISTRFSWVPAHVGVDGNEKVAILAKQTLKNKASRFSGPIK